MPEQWGLDFSLIHGDPSRVLEHKQADFLHYFTLQEGATRRAHNSDRIDPGNGNNIHNGNNRRSLRHNRGGGRENGRDDGQRNNGREYDNHNRGRGRDRDRNDTSNHNTRARTMNPEDPCLIRNHSYHIWGDCRQNPSSDNYDPRPAIRERTDNNQGRGRGRQNGRGQQNNSGSGNNGARNDNSQSQSNNTAGKATNANRHNNANAHNANAHFRDTYVRFAPDGSSQRFNNDGSFFEDSPPARRGWGADDPYH
jgi:hypothetical protein